MAMLGLGVAGGRRRRTRRGGGYYGAGGVDPFSGPTFGGRRRTLKAKTLRRMLKKKGMKTTGKKATLMKRLHMKGGRYVPVGTNAAAWNGGFDMHEYGGEKYMDTVPASLK